MRWMWFVLVAISVVGCGDDDDDGSTEADKRGVGAACTKNEDCSEPGQSCLAFKGGYCGIANCTGDIDCPQGSACVAHTDGTNYCFRICIDKVECNRNRPVDAEANCSSNIDFVDNPGNVKACVPPSS